MTLEDFLRMRVALKMPASGDLVLHAPEFVITVIDRDAEFQKKKGIHISVRPNWVNSTSIQLLVTGNKTYKLY